MRLTYILITFTLLLSCNSLKKETLDSKPLQESEAVAIEPDAPETTIIGDSTFQEEVKDWRKSLIHKYDTTIYFEDFRVLDSNDTLTFGAEYYCLFDSALVLPPKWVWESEQSFTTHNYALAYKIHMNDSLIVMDTVTKEDFMPILTETLNEYAALLFPNFRGYSYTNNCFEYGFSLTIPVTDVGQGKTIQLNLDGSKEIK